MRGLKGRDVAPLLGVAASTVVGWRTGRRGIPRWAKHALVGVSQRRRRAAGPPWFIGYAPDPPEATHKYAIHLHPPGFIHDGERVICWLDSPRGVGKKKLLLLIAKAMVMVRSAVW